MIDDLKRNNSKRNLDVVVISDVHLGTYGCHAKELLNYLKSINPNIVILNGDIIDIWQFNKRYWPKSHMKVIKHLVGWISQNKQVYYITGNHDEMLRKFQGFQMGSFYLKNKLVLELDGYKNWFFHGDVFDVTMKHSKWITKLGAVGYDGLILVNRSINGILRFLGRDKISLSKKVKGKVKSAIQYINNFEHTVAHIAIENNFDHVICGHIHQPEIKSIEVKQGGVIYLNSGDWIENLTALEYCNQKWSLFKYHENSVVNEEPCSLEKDLVDQSNKEIFTQILEEFKIRVS